jgi:hypothetical protein
MTLRLIFVSLLFITGCAGALALAIRSPAIDCADRVCPAAAAYEQTTPEGSTYDPYDNTCICTFRDGRMLTTRR